MVRYIVALFCTTALSVAAAVIGLYLPPLASLWKGLAIACAVCVVCICIVNLVADFKHVDRFIKMTERQHLDNVLRLRSQIERDYKRAERRVWALVVCGYVYLGVFILLCMTGIACLTALDSTGFIVAFAIPVLGLFMRLFAKKEPDDPKFGFEEEEYPRLYEIARKAQQAVGCRGRLLIDFAEIDEPLGVTESHGVIEAVISPIFYAICTDEELYAAFLHEFGHIKNRDTKKARRFAWQKAFWLREESLGSAIFISSVAGLLFEKISAYEQISSRYFEEEADRQVLLCGAEQPFINAVVKGQDIFICFNMFRRETMYDIYASETPVSDYMTLELATYEAYRVKWAKIWDQIHANRLSSLMDSHPSLRERMESLGVKSYDVLQRETNAVACAERKKMLKLSDNLSMQSFADGYEEQRQENYLTPKSLMEQYLEAEEGGAPLPLEMLAKCSSAFYGIDNARAIKIAEELIEKNFNADVGHDVLGKIYYHLMDERCLEEFKAEMRLRPGAYEECMRYMREFVLRTGDRDHIRQFGEESIETVQQAVNKINATKWKVGKQPLRESSLSKELTEELCRRAATYGDLVRRVYVGEYGEKIAVTVVVLEMRVPVRSAQWVKVFDELSDYLDAYCVLALFCDISGKGIVRALQKAKLSPVWER